jgi:hypothetical protein
MIVVSVERPEKDVGDFRLSDRSDARAYELLQVQRVR